MKLLSPRSSSLRALPERIFQDQLESCPHFSLQGRVQRADKVCYFVRQFYTATGRGHLTEKLLKGIEFSFASK